MALVGWVWSRRHYTSRIEKDALINIYVELLDEGTACWRRIIARSVGNELFEILPSEDYDPDDEVWKFLPGALVKLEYFTIGSDPPDMHEVPVAIDPENEPAEHESQPRLAARLRREAGQ
jgi:hypothetical protein